MAERVSDKAREMARRVAVDCPPEHMHAGLLREESGAPNPGGMACDECIAAAITEAVAQAREERDAEWCAALWPTNPEGDRNVLTPEQGAVWYRTLVEQEAFRAREEEREACAGFVSLQMLKLDVPLERIEDLAKRLTSGNAAHHGREIEQTVRAIRGGIHKRALPKSIRARGGSRE